MYLSLNLGVEKHHHFQFQLISAQEFIIGQRKPLKIKKGLPGSEVHNGLI